MHHMVEPYYEVEEGACGAIVGVRQLGLGERRPHLESLSLSPGAGLDF